MSQFLPLILMVEDDPDDRLLAREAVERIGIDNGILFLDDGVDLMDYLRQRGKHLNRGVSPKPGLIVLDLKMPRMNGIDVLSEIQLDEDLNRIPVVVLTTSQDQEDRSRAIHLGASGYYTKPMRFNNLVDTMRSILAWWSDQGMKPSES